MSAALPQKRSYSMQKKTKGRVDIGVRIPQLMRQFLSNSGNGDNRTNRCGTVGTAEIKVASAYILFNSAHRTALRIGSHRHVSRLSNFRERDDDKNKLIRAVNRCLKAPKQSFAP